MKEGGIMKTKLQFIALASLAVMGAGCLAVTTGIIANEKEELSINAAQLEEKDTSYDIWTPGNAVYLGMTNNGGWLADYANFAMYYFSQDGSKAWTPIFREVTNYDLKLWPDKQQCTLYESVVPENPNGTSWDYLIAVRLDASGSTGFDHKWNQTANIPANTDKHNMITVTGLNNDNCWYTNDFSIEHEDRIATWGATVNWWGPNNICNSDGASADRDQLKAGWEASAETFNALGYDARAYFSNVQAMDEADPQAHN